MLTVKNFCHIEELQDGSKILFYAEHDGEDIVLHQVTHVNVGTFDLKITFPEEFDFDKHWETFNFIKAADTIVKTINEWGLTLE